MKLLTRTTLYFAVISLPVFAVGGIILYHTVRSVARNDAHEKLRNEKNMILNYVKKYNYLPHNSMEFGDSVGFTQVSFAQVTETLKDTVLYNFAEKEMEQNLMLVFKVDAGNATYRAVIFKPLIETDDLTNAIFQAMAIAGAILLILLLALSVIVTNKLWGPFYESLQKLKSFDLNKGGRMELSKTGISEFNELNTALMGMTAKIASDYTNLKEFTENASHEIQTPLTIIQSKLELLIQSENFSAEQMEKVQAVYESASRLSKLNEALLLLTKIENRQFMGIENIQLDKLVERKLEHFKELSDLKKIKTNVQTSQLSVMLHPMLAEILVGNLISNAIKHNVEGGLLQIKAGAGQLVVENSGKPLSGNPEDLFRRFKKDDQSADSLGLGLAIVKEICNSYGFRIQYSFYDNMHSIAVFF